MIKDINELLEKIPVWREIIKLPKRIEELEQKIKILEVKLNEQNKKIKCPFCEKTDLKLLKISPHSVMAETMNTLFYQCLSCNQTFDKDSKRTT